MDNQLLHIAFDHALRSVAWDGHGDNEYILIGDGSAIDCSRLQSLIDASIGADLMVWSPDRHTALIIARSVAARTIADDLLKTAAVTVADASLRSFVQVHPMGIARTGVANATVPSFEQDIGRTFSSRLTR